MAWTNTNFNAPSYDVTGWCEKTALTCHTTLGRYVKNLPLDSLGYVAADCRDAIAAYPEGRKSGHYQDTIHGISDRLHRQRNKG